MSVSDRFRNLSGVAAILIAAIHVPFAFPAGVRYEVFLALFHNGLTRIAVPFFFFASGYWLVNGIAHDEGCGDIRGWYGESIRKRGKSLLVPYVCGNWLFWIWLAILSWMGAMLSTAVVPLNISIRSFVGALGIPCVTAPMNYVLWFVRCLMLFVLISPVFVKIIRKGRAYGWWMLALLAIGAYLVRKYVAPPPAGGWVTLFDLYGLVYFALGIVVRYYPVRLPALAWKMVDAIRVPQIVQRNAMGVFVFQLFFYQVVMTIGVLAGGDGKVHGIIGYICAWVGAVVVSIIISESLKRFCPLVAKLLLGGR